MRDAGGEPIFFISQPDGDSVPVYAGADAAAAANRVHLNAFRLLQGKRSTKSAGCASVGAQWDESGEISPLSRCLAEGESV